MIDFFLKTKQKLESMLPVTNNQLSTNKTVSQLIAEIHDTFYTEVDRLLEESSISYSLETQKQQLIQKADDLKALGFTSTKEVAEADTEKGRISMLKSQNEDNQKLNRAIHYFTFKYPHYKFITEESVKRICQKYNLIYGEVSCYIGTVPDVNLQQIKNFKIKEEDICYSAKLIKESLSNVDFVNKYFTKKEAEKVIKSSRYDDLYPVAGVNRENEPVYFPASMKMFLSDPHFSYYFGNCDIAPLEIAAPRKDFNISNAEVKNFKLSSIEIPDPVVLHPVVYENEKYYLIVTAWGDEAHDPLVQNPKLN